MEELLTSQTYPFQLPPLPYPYEALEGSIDATTMNLHHQKHHQTYITKLNAALENKPHLQKKNLMELLSLLPKLEDETTKSLLINHAGGSANHALFWLTLNPEKTIPSDRLNGVILKAYGSFDGFQKNFTQIALSLFGSGWTWLVINNEGQLKIITTPNQNSPIMDGMTPLLGLDLWEHAYYLKYQNRREEYVNNWWSIINWDKVSNLFTQARS